MNIEAIAEAIRNFKNDDVLRTKLTKGAETLQKKYH
jgi:hypothetical protein